MTKQEFEKLTGRSCDAVYFADVIEPMYMATNLDKYDFCRMINADTIPEDARTLSAREEERAVIDRIRDHAAKLRAEVDNCRSELDRGVFISWNTKRIACISAELREIKHFFKVV